MLAHLALLLIVHGQSHQPVPEGLSTLLNELHNPSQADYAASRFVQVARLSPDALDESKSLLASALVGESDSSAYRSEVRIAGELGLTGLAVLIAKGLDTDTRDWQHRIGGFSVEVRAEYDPAVATLISFGLPSVDALEEELAHGKPLGRRRSALALNAIGGSRAKQILRRHYPQEKDPAVKTFIGATLGIFGGR